MIQDWERSTSLLLQSSNAPMLGDGCKTLLTFRNHSSFYMRLLPHCSALLATDQ